MKKAQQFSLQDLKDILIKKATGFFYDEEQLEYELAGTEKEKSLKKKERTESIETKSKQSQNLESGETEKIANTQNLKTMENIDENISKLVVVKKKVSTHYIPPDSLAVKMLFEIFGKEITTESEVDRIKNMSNEELEFELKKVEKQIEETE